MKISDKCVVRFHYTLKDETGIQLESSLDGDAAAYLHGYNNIVPGLESALQDKDVGEKLSVTLHPGDAYGAYREGAVQRIPIKHLSGAKKWKPGMLAMINTAEGPRQVQIVKVGKFMADADFNHPLAGKVLTFDVEIIEVREASEEELQHRHAHGDGGHHH